MGVNSMRECKLDGRQMDTRAEAWVHIREVLALPAYFGNNLDALADCLGEIQGVTIHLVHANAARNALGTYADRLIQVFEQASAGRADLTFRVSQR